MTADQRPVMRQKLGSVLAPAKINLALHVVGRRADGYHLIDSLVVFADWGDRLTAFVREEGPTLVIEGPFAAGLSAGEDNLVCRAERQFRAALAAGSDGSLPDVALHLDKYLPVSSGIGGGSADGAATLRLLAKIAGGVEPGLLEALAGKLGADGPMCLRSTSLRARGIGEALEDWGPLPPLFLVLVNPGVAVSTPAVFKRLAKADNPPLPASLPPAPDADSLAAFLKAETRNDLAAAAKAEAPVIAAVEAAVAASAGCLLARMSGSGATVFGLYRDAAAAAQAARSIAGSHPDWWVRATATLAPGAAEPRGLDETV